MAPRIFTGSPFVPITSATVDGHHRERRQAGGDGLGQPLFDAAVHHGGRATSLAVQRDHRSQRFGLTRRPGDRPVGGDPAARRGHERAGHHRRGRRGRRIQRWVWRQRNPGAGHRHRRRHRRPAGKQPVHRIGAERSGRRAGAQTQHGATTHLWHAGHHKVPLIGPPRRCAARGVFVRKGNAAPAWLAPCPR